MQGVTTITAENAGSRYARTTSALRYPLPLPDDQKTGVTRVVLGSSCCLLAKTIEEQENLHTGKMAERSAYSTKASGRAIVRDVWSCDGIPPR